MQGAPLPVPRMPLVAEMPPVMEAPPVPVMEAPPVPVMQAPPVMAAPPVMEAPPVAVPPPPPPIAEVAVIPADTGETLPELLNFKDSWEPWEPNDMPVFFHIPKAGGSTVKDVMGTCHRFVMATESGVTDGHIEDTVSKESTVCSMQYAFLQKAPPKHPSCR